jgi:uncharacterized membrane protein
MTKITMKYIKLFEKWQYDDREEMDHKTYPSDEDMDRETYDHYGLTVEYIGNLVHNKIKDFGRNPEVAGLSIEQFFEKNENLQKIVLVGYNESTGGYDALPGHSTDKKTYEFTWKSEDRQITEFLRDVKMYTLEEFVKAIPNFEKPNLDDISLFL